MSVSPFAKATQTAMAERGLSSSSMMAEALADGLLTASIPIAKADADTYKQMIFQNLSNRQQSNMLKAQQTQQRMLSNQSASNAAKQFNSTSENQTQQFMASLNAQVEQFNVSQKNTMEQFNVTSTNAAAARDAADAGGGLGMHSKRQLGKFDI